MGNKQIMWKKVYLIDRIVEEFAPEKYDFFDIVHREGDNRQLFEFELENPTGLMSFTGAIDCWDNGESYEVDDITITELEIIDPDCNACKELTVEEIEEILREQNYNL